MASKSVCEFTRTGEISLDLLELYLTSKFYDCSIKVGAKDTEYQVFKCHKLVLATASEVFEKMLYGSFKEANLGRDEPILLTGISPENFDIAMRFVYGNVEEFDRSSSPIQIYRFAHEMQLTKLLDALDIFLKTAGPSTILTVYDLYRETENISGQKKCWDVIFSNPADTLASDSWLRASIATVQDVLQNSNFVIPEIERLKALIRWGEYQVQKDGKILADKKVREKVMPCFKYVMFSSIGYAEFAEFCTTTKSLTTEEKYQIMLCLALKTEKYMPVEFVGGVLQPRAKSVSLDSLKLTCRPLSSTTAMFGISSFCVTEQEFKLEFKIQPSANILSFNVNSALISSIPSSTKYLLKDSQNQNLDESNDFDARDQPVTFKLNNRPRLVENEIYTLVLCFPDSKFLVEHGSQSIHPDVVCDSPTVKVTHCTKLQNSDQLFIQKLTFT